VAGQLRDGVLKRRDAKNAEKTFPCRSIRKNGMELVNASNDGTLQP